MNLTQEAEIKLQKYKGLNDDDPSVMQVSEVPYSEVLAVQGRNGPPGNTQGSNQVQDLNAPRLSWKVNRTCYKCREKGHQA